MRAAVFSAVLLLATAPSLQAGTFPFRITEVIPDPASGDQIVEVTNVSDTSEDILGYQLCVVFTYAALSSTVLAPGESVRIHVGVGGTDTDTDKFTGALFPMLGTSADGVSFYRPGGGFPFFGNPDNIVDFVQYGAGSQPRADVAVAAGIWPSLGEFTPAPATGVSLAWDGDGETAADWFRDASPTLGEPNASGTAAVVDVGPGCSASTAPELAATSLPALGNQDLDLTIASRQPGKAAILFVGVGTISSPILLICTFYVNTVPIGLEIPLVMNGSGGATLPVFIEDPAFVGVEIGLQVVIDNDDAVPKFDLSNGLGLTF